MEIGLRLSLLPQVLAVCRLEPRAGLPDWALAPKAGEGRFWSLTRTPEEVSLVCGEERLPRPIPPGTRVETGWRALMVAGPLDFGQTGILSSLAGPLARARVPVFVLSTFETDYLLLKEGDLNQAREVLVRAGHELGEDFDPAGA